LNQASAAVSRILGRLALLARSVRDSSGPSDAIDPFVGFRRAAARLTHLDGIERLVPVGVCALLVVAALVSALPEVTPASAAARATAGASSGVVAAEAPFVQFGAGDGPDASPSSDVYLGDGSIPNTLQNPGTGTDARSLLRTYNVKSGDNLAAIANHYGLATSTIYWANRPSLPDPSSLRIGQQLVIPPMDGLIVTVTGKDTLASLAAKWKVPVQDIVDANNLPEPTVVLGEVLILPGVSGGPMPVARKGAPIGVTVAGRWVWPLASSSYYVSQYFWSGHRAIDIATAYGTAVVAAASGTVVFAGNRGYLGGGYVVWIQHGAKLFSTYNHLSVWNVRAGQTVRAGQIVGRVGLTGETTGPHLHFEVWLSYPWANGTSSTAVNPCAYLAGC